MSRGFTAGDRAEHTEHAHVVLPTDLAQPFEAVIRQDADDAEFGRVDGTRAGRGAHDFFARGADGDDVYLRNLQDPLPLPPPRERGGGKNSKGLGAGTASTQSLKPYVRQRLMVSQLGVTPRPGASGG